MDDGVPASSQREFVNVGSEEDGGAPASGGSSSSTSGAPPSTETSACEQRRDDGEPKMKKRRVRDTGSDDEEFSMIAEAINKFTEAYVQIETTKIESKKTAIDHETKMAMMNIEMEERRYKSMLETQLAMAKLIAEAVKVALDRCLSTRDA